MTTYTKLAEILDTLDEEADPEARQAMGDQYGIHAGSSYGVPMRRLLQIAKATGIDHDLALALWDQGSYEAQTLAAMVDDPGQVTRDQMQRWCEDFDNWAVVDTVCFRLFDKCTHAWTMVDCWVADDRLFVRRAGFALIWALALHDRAAPDHQFLKALDYAQAASRDQRPLVGKSITMAMRAIATKRPTLLTDVVTIANRLCDDGDPAARRVGRPIQRSFGTRTSAGN
ncbi:DNA alkylation repair protein [Arthrobacter sp. zg-Y916]|uniref:DNA alkylation repair protein n=1 Tax=Arthrobacter sp. zg-Y916 TaxID=2894190 RepID=UPI001E5BF64E|nr:DNA alkylation repair protein [Arthrobacter sp. zg-Y916]MCC9193523.1 DNA alkylation repair protein [Arthrobacter sp. zg-Y916]